MMNLMYKIFIKNLKYLDFDYKILIRPHPSETVKSLIRLKISKKF